jgi:hypothetical protein
VNRAVIDTNVLLVANGRHADISPECVIECVARLEALQQTGITVIDDGFRILGEYQNKTQLNPAKGVGDVFLKWLLRHVGNERHVEQVKLTETHTDEFFEFPDAELQPRFDAADRKFVAVANAHPNKPPIWQAADCKWLDWWKALHKQGVTMEFLCPKDVRRFYAKKFPEASPPEMPGQ